jgi:predicted DNA-binding protein
MTMIPEKKGTKSFPLRLTPTMRRQIDHLAKREGVSLNQFISLAVAEKVTRMEGYSLSDGPEMAWIKGRLKGLRKL